ncbi:unnamed protein product [Caenorhabditis angaria]|uniref:C3H1-type domain-containing protein n=1 Tax=Caenorhabditis angaria TaxID=860376 RepID=A0A9P1IBI7_9PELO|nr:unnamed protein product [Caenorhabditis angaria]
MSQSQSESHRREYRKFKKPPQARNKPSNTICKFLATPEGCKFAEKCRFRHDNNVIPSEEMRAEFENLEISSSEIAPQHAEIFEPKVLIKTANPVKPFIPSLVKLKKVDLGSLSQKQQLKAEIEFFKKRYRHCQISENTSTNNTSIDFRYTITDPDWVLDLKSLNLQIILDSNHPISPPIINLLQESNLSLPTLTQSYLEAKIREAINSKYKLFEKRDSFETIGKALIKWIDHSIVEIFTEALRRTKMAMFGENIGLSLVMPKSEEKNEEKTVEPERIDIQEDRESKSIDIQEVLESTSEEYPKFENQNKTSCESFKPIDILPIEIYMIWKDQSNNIATIRAISLRICTKCARCGTEKDNDLKLDEKIVGWRCQKCSQAQSLR